MKIPAGISDAAKAAIPALLSLAPGEAIEVMIQVLEQMPPLPGEDGFKRQRAEATDRLTEMAIYSQVAEGGG